MNRISLAQRYTSREVNHGRPAQKRRDPGRSADFQSISIAWNLRSPRRFSRGLFKRKDAARPSRNQSQTSLNAETQRNAEKRREKELSANLCDSLRISVPLR